MRKSTISAALAAFMLSGSSMAAAPTIPAYVTAAIADATRPDADKTRDANRKPAEVLAFAGVKPGDKVGELMPGRGYYTRLLCHIAGTSGQVYAIGFTMNIPGRGPPPPMAPPCPNVSVSSVKGAEFAMPANGLDVVWTSENYHDFHLDMIGLTSMQSFNKMVYDALKPGGIFLVEDHVAAAGSGKRDASTLHRIDPATVIQEVTSVGFVLDGRSDVLSNPADDHTKPVFTLGGKSDKFLLKFRKPAR